MTQSQYDVVLYGASGFTGRQTVSYFDQHAPADLRWAVAGRNRDKLTRVVNELVPGTQPDIIQADGDDDHALRQLCESTRIVLTTAGPFAVYGRKLVEACVATNTHYVDITGETPFVADLISNFHETAAKNACRIIPCCGFDSVPSDLGAYLCAEFLRERGLQTQAVRAKFKLKGGLNGGTVASALNMAESRQGRQLRDVLLLNPEAQKTTEERAESADVTWPVKDDTSKRWLAPFVMAPVNSRVVRRSNGLFSIAGKPYGSDFRYSEYHDAGSLVNAWTMTLGLGTFGALLGSGFGRWLIKRMTPSPGSGPSESTMDGGFFSSEFVGYSSDVAQVRVKISSAGDPGNRVTVTALCESALALATNETALPGVVGTGGVLTPATGLGQILIDRLTAQGWSFEISPI